MLDIERQRDMLFQVGLRRLRAEDYPEESRTNARTARPWYILRRATITHRTSYIAKLTLTILLASIGWPQTETAKACTSGVADSTVTADKRPLLWKSRNWGASPPNEVALYTDGPYRYIGIRSHDGKAMMGLNEAGLCTGNTLVGKPRGTNGKLMHHMLANFATVAEVRSYLKQQHKAGALTANGCFPLMDRAGNAMIFEIDGPEYLQEYAAAAPARAAQGMAGFVVRGNEFHKRTDGSDNTEIGQHYQSGMVNIRGLINAGALSARTITQGNDGPNGYEFMRYGPDRELPSIAYETQCSTMTVHGVAVGEDPRLSTMWAIMGHANYGLAVPTWVSVATVPTVLADGSMAGCVSSLMAKGNEARTQESTLPFELHLFNVVSERLLPEWRTRDMSDPAAAAEVAAQMQRVETQMANDAYSLLDCLDNSDDDNKAPLIAIDSCAADSLDLAFTTTAADKEDGNLTGGAWDYGDGQRGNAEAHRYDKPGRYLVSVTFVDSSGVSQTDWLFVTATAPGGASLNNDFGILANNVGVIMGIMLALLTAACYLTLLCCKRRARSNHESQR